RIASAVSSAKAHRPCHRPRRPRCLVHALPATTAFPGQASARSIAAVAAPSQRRALGGLFAALALAFAGIAAAAGAAGQWVILAAATAIAAWFVTLAARAFR